MHLRLSDTFLSLKLRDFRLLWMGQLSTSMGIWMDNVTRGWLMYDLTGSPFLLGLTGAFKAVPMLVFGVLAGVLADRYARKPQIIIAQFVNMAVNLLLAVLVVTHMVQPWHVLATALIAGTASAFQQPARQAIVSDLVEEKYLTNAISLNSMAFNISRSLGPVIAGILVALIGVAGAYFFQAAIYLSASIWTIQIAVPKLAHGGPGGDNRREVSILQDILVGLRYIKSDRVIFALLLLSLIPTLLGQPYVSLMPVFAKDIFRAGPEGLGVLMSAIGLGAIVGALMVGTFKQGGQKGLILLAQATVFGISLLFFAFNPWFGIALPILWVAGFTYTGYSVLTNTLIQSHTPPKLRGRVLSIYFLNHGLMPLGILLAGGMAEVLGAPMSVGILGIACAILPVVVALTVPHIRR
ncbi:MAG: MFS transporter, partial [Dehalococcoidia bacterium]|nr:MFS transporter [Dehalococcoidia bacterium]